KELEAEASANQDRRASSPVLQGVGKRLHGFSCPSRAVGFIRRTGEFAMLPVPAPVHQPTQAPEAPRKLLPGAHERQEGLERVEGEAPSSETGTSLDSPSAYRQGPSAPGSGLGPDHSELTPGGAYGLYAGPPGQQRTRRPKLQHSTSILRKQAEEEAIKRSRGRGAPGVPLQTKRCVRKQTLLTDAEVEMLERKYGGRLVTRHAARTIQTAFRQYQMNKNFERLRSSMSENRMSRRIGCSPETPSACEDQSHGHAVRGQNSALNGEVMCCRAHPEAVPIGAARHLVSVLLRGVHAHTQAAFPTVLKSHPLPGGSFPAQTPAPSRGYVKALNAGSKVVRRIRCRDSTLPCTLSLAGCTQKLAVRFLPAQGLLVPSTSCAASRRILTVAWEAWLLAAGPRDPRRWLEAAEPEVLAVPGHLLVLDVLTEERLPPAPSEPLAVVSGLQHSDRPAQAARGLLQQVKVTGGAVVAPADPAGRRGVPAECRPAQSRHAALTPWAVRLLRPLRSLPVPGGCGLRRGGLAAVRLHDRGFVPDTPVGVAHFLLQRKGLSRQMIGEFLGNRQKQFNRDVLDGLGADLPQGQRQGNRLDPCTTGSAVLSLPHRRLVCYCRLFEVTKIFQKKKNSVTYSFRQSFSLYGMQVLLFENQCSAPGRVTKDPDPKGSRLHALPSNTDPDYPNGIRLTSAVPGADIKVLINFNAPNPQDRKKFTDDLRESIAEVQEMEKHRIESKSRMSAELEKQKGVVRPSMSQCSSLKKEPGGGTLSRACLDDSYASGEGLKRSALSSSLRDLSEAVKIRIAWPA
ncbi:hypothetical protein E2I00_007854, partial [Balaenoptera physalus]